MRTLAVLMIALGAACAQDAEPNMACVERLAIPKYPALAAQARISGNVAATITIDSDGSTHTNTTGHSLLAPYTKDAIHRSRFRSDCGGKTLKLIFHFDFDADPLKAVSFSYPNQFWITVPPPDLIGAP